MAHQGGKKLQLQQLLRGDDKMMIAGAAATAIHDVRPLLSPSFFDRYVRTSSLDFGTYIHTYTRMVWHCHTGLDRLHGTYA